MGITNSATSTAPGKVNLSRSGENLVLRFEGDWNVRETQHSEIDALFTKLNQEGPTSGLQIDMSSVGTWDTSLLIVVARAEDWVDSTDQCGRCACPCCRVCARRTRTGCAGSGCECCWVDRGEVLCSAWNVGLCY